MPVATMEELIALERDPSVRDVELSTTSRVRRRMLRGEVVDPREVTTELGGHVSLTAQVAMQLRSVGFDVEGEPGPTGMCYRVTNPDYEPTHEQYEAAREAARVKSAEARERAKAKAAAAQEAKKAQAAAKATKKAAKAVNATTAVDAAPTRDVADRDGELPPLPDLGQPVTVYALALNDDGTITLGLRNGSRRWVSTITGTIE